MQHAPYFDLNGRQQNHRRGRTFDALQACYKHFLACFMPLDSAERQTRYSDIVIKKHKDSEIVALAYCLDEMNGMQVSAMSQDDAKLSGRNA